MRLICSQLKSLLLVSAAISITYLFTSKAFIGKIHCGERKETYSSIQAQSTLKVFGYFVDNSSINRNEDNSNYNKEQSNNSKIERDNFYNDEKVNDKDYDRDDFKNNMQDKASSEETFHLNPTFNCTSRSHATQPRVDMRGTKYWVLYNYIRAERSFECHESVSFSTHGQVEFLDNLEVIVDRWRGPVSVSVYCPGSDYFSALDAILLLRECSSKADLIRTLVTFHLFFEVEHIPENTTVFNQEELHTYMRASSCDVIRTRVASATSSYKSAHDLDYPINVARNVARETAATHFVMAVDIELYPSPGLADAFLDMMRSNESLSSRERTIYAISPFEIKPAAIENLPSAKTQLVDLLREGTVKPFQQLICTPCHAVPGADEWGRRDFDMETMRVTTISKRVEEHHHWEPFYIGTHDIPMWDERLTWEGRSDKMVQASRLCLLDYDFAVLSTPFLIHKPGIKSYKASRGPPEKVESTNRLLREQISKEFRAIYGTREGCTLP